MVATAIVVVAVRSDGYAAYDADLNDGGVWVTSSSDGSYGRLNKPIGQLDGVLFAEKKGALDIVQEGAVVVGVDTAGGRLLPIDPATISNPPGNSARIPSQAQVQLSGGTLAVLDPERGRVWTQVVGRTRDQQVQVSGLDVEVDPIAELGPRSPDLHPLARLARSVRPAPRTRSNPPPTPTKEPHRDSLDRTSRLVQGDLRPVGRQHGEGRAG